VAHCTTTLLHVRPCRDALQHDPAARAPVPDDFAKDLELHILRSFAVFAAGDDGVRVLRSRKERPLR
jgi:hypothetical protein